MKGLVKYSNDDIVEGIRKQDSIILQYVIDTCHRSVMAYVQKNGGDRLDADDVLQEAVIILYRKVRDAKFVLTSKVSTFVFSVATHLWLKELDQRAKLKGTSDFPDTILSDEDLNESIYQNERLKLFREKFEELGEDCKKVLHMFYLGTSLKQITTFMGYASDDYTKKKKYTCKNILVKKIKSSTQFKELGHE